MPPGSCEKQKDNGANMELQGERFEIRYFEINWEGVDGINHIAGFAGELEGKPAKLNFILADVKKSHRSQTETKGRETFWFLCSLTL